MKREPKKLEIHGLLKMHLVVFLAHDPYPSLDKNEIKNESNDFFLKLHVLNVYETSYLGQTVMTQLVKQKSYHSHEAKHFFECNREK